MRLLPKRDKLARRKPGKVTAVVLAGGSSSRMGRDKLSVMVGGMTVIERTLRAFQACSAVDAIVLVTRMGEERAALSACAVCPKVERAVHGGDTRTQSAYQGVMAADADSEILLIHDGARPFVSDAVIRAAIEGARDYGAALPATPVTDTIKTEKGGFVDATPERAALFAAQTPQAFRAELIKAALSDAVEKGLSLTDDCAAVERLGMRVKLVAGDPANRKLTTPVDLLLAEALCREHERV